MGLDSTARKIIALFILSILLFVLFLAWWFDLTIWLLQIAESNGLGIATGLVLLCLLVYARTKYRRGPN